MLEEDLFQPVSDFLVEAGYSVRSEVAHCDIMATKGEELLAVELKKGLTLALLVQSVDRQKSADRVYMAVPRPETSMRSGKWKSLLHLIRRLELGLMFVHQGGGKARVEIVIDALPFDRERSRRQNKKKRIHALAEMNGRLRDYNTGGSAGKKLMTAYKESCIMIAVCLKKFGPMSPKQLKDLGADPKKTKSILYSNFYGWFDHTEKGVYAISDKGKKELRAYPELTGHYSAEIRKNRKLKKSGAD